MLSLTLALAVTILAADSDDWGRVKALSKGTNVTVIQSDMKSVRGPVDAASDNEIVVGGTAIAKARVARISSHKTSHRVLNAVALGVAGGLIGGGITRFGAACAETNDGCRNAALATFGGAIGGAVIGALAFPGTVEVYRVKKLASPGTSGHSE